jgi:hypothetical protein
MSNEGKPIQDQIRDTIVVPYAARVAEKHPTLVNHWPVISGYNIVVGTFNGWTVIVLKHTGSTAMWLTDVIGELAPEDVGVAGLSEDNKELARQRLVRHFGLTSRDVVLFSTPQGFNVAEYDVMMRRHEYAKGIAPMKVFLSHKTADKPLVRQFKQLLVELGFDPWLDEDAMSAGTELERALLKGFADSCAAVFFITPNFKDEDYLASEVDYAIGEKRKKGDKFQIITLVLSDDGRTGAVPELLRRYVYKEPATHLQAFHEVLKALPLQVGAPYWRS